MSMQAQPRLESVDQTGLGLDRRSLMVFLVAFFGWMLVNVDGAFFNMTYPIIQKELGITNDQISYIFTAMNVFGALAVFLIGPAMDHFGRRKVFIGTLWLTAIGSVFSGLAASFGTMCVLRVIVSMGSSTEMTSGQVMVAEISSSKNRNFLLGLAQIGYPLGYFASTLITNLLVPSFGWRTLFFLGFIPILVILILRRGVGESERFLELKKVRAEAKRLAEVKHVDLGEAAEEVGTVFKVNKKQALKSAYHQLFDGDMRRTSILLFLWILFFNMGCPAIIMFLPMVVAHYNIPIEGMWFVAGAASATSIVAYLITSYFGNKHGGKRICIIFTPFAVLAGIYLAFFANTLATITVGYVAFYFFSVGQYGAVPGVMMESFPTRIRGTGGAFVGASTWIGYILASLTMPIYFKSFGIPGTVLVWTAIIPFIATLFLAGTKYVAPRQELEEIAY